MKSKLLSKELLRKPKKRMMLQMKEKQKYDVQEGREDQWVYSVDQQVWPVVVDDCYDSYNY